MSQFFRPERRPLSKEERALLEWLINNGIPDAQKYASQLKDVIVFGGCTCGCPTIDLAVGQSENRKTGASHLLADFQGRTPEGIEVVVILHAREGKLSELEVYAIPNMKEPFNLPTIESLR
jgi:hypothetical protein